MTSFKGLKCPVCDVEFSDADDIVVCPECGAPYHRACYKQIGHCLYDHSAGQGWKAPAPETPAVEAQAPAGETLRCPRCHAENPAGSLFCNSCGASLMGGASAQPGRTGTAGGPGDAYTSFFSAASGLHPEELVADDVTVEEAAKAVQVNSLYYVPVFKSIRERNRSRFNFSALFFSGGWLLYRKQYKLGGILLGLTTLLSVVSTVSLIFGVMPLMMEIYTKCGLDAATMSLTYEQQLAVMAEVQNYPQLLGYSWLSILPMIANGIISIVLGFRGNRIYYNHLMKKIRSIRSECPPEADRGAYHLELTRRGGVNPKIILLMALLYMLLNYLPYLLM